MAFTRSYLQAGRLWLGIASIGVRTVAILLGALAGGSINYSHIDALGTVGILGDSVVAVAEAEPSPLLPLAQSALALLALFIADATSQMWRRGDRSRALTRPSRHLFRCAGPLPDEGRGPLFWRIVR